MVEQWDEPEPDWVSLVVFALALEKAGGTDCTGAQRILATHRALRILATDRNSLETAAMFNRAFAVPTSLSGGLGLLYSVEIGEVAIYARPGSLANPFQRVGRDVWRSLGINPQDGSAVATDGTQFFSIHVKEVAPSPNSETAAGTNVQATALGTAVERCLGDLGRPPENVSWSKFCDAVRDECNGWKKDRKQGEYKRGYSDKTIARCVRVLLGNALSSK